MNCREFQNHIEEYVDRTLSRDLAADAEVHLGMCRKCASLVKELEGTSQMVRILPRQKAPIGFEERLKARMATQPRHRGRLGSIAAFLFGRPRNHRQMILRPVLAVLVVCALILGSAMLMEQGGIGEKSSTDWAYIEACQEQHASFASTNPLADDSAVILRERARDLEDSL